MSRSICLFYACVFASLAHAQPVTIAAVGDVMLGSFYPFVAELPPQDGQQLFADVKEQWDNADAVFANLEGVLIDDLSTMRECPPNSLSCFRFAMPSRYAGLLERAGFNAVSTGNNHVQDFGDVGRLETLIALAKHGLNAFGTVEQPTATQILPNGTRIGWIGFAPHRGSNPPSVDSIRTQVAALKRLHNIVIVSMHIGAEGAKAQRVTRDTELFLGYDRGNPYLLARTAVDAGADLVLGHGPHVLRAMELYKGRLIAYSLGNFSTYGRFNLKGPNGIGGILKATLDENGKLLRARFISTRQERGSAAWQQGIAPVLDPTHQAARTIRDLSLADFPESPLYIDRTGRMTWTEPAAETQSVKALSALNRSQAATPAKPVAVTAAPQARPTDRSLIRVLYTRSRDVIRNIARY